MSVDPEREQARLARKARRRGARRERILDAARGLLLDGGTEALTTGQVAAAADLSQPAIYYYFADKQALIDELAVEAAEAEAEAMSRAVEAADDGPSALAAMLRAKVRHGLAHPEAARLLHEGLVRGGVSERTLKERIYPLSGRVNGALEARLEADRRSGRVHREAAPRKLANVAFATAQGIVTLALAMERLGGALLFSPEELAEEACAALLRGLRPGPPAGTEDPAEATVRGWKPPAR